MKTIINSIACLCGIASLTACSSLQQAGQDIAKAGKNVTGNFFDSLGGMASGTAGNNSAGGAVTASQTNSSTQKGLASCITVNKKFSGVSSSYDNTNLERIEITFLKVETDIGRVSGEISSEDAKGVRCLFTGNIVQNRLNLKVSEGNGDARNIKSQRTWLMLNHTYTGELTFDGSQLNGNIYDSKVTFFEVK